MNDIIKKLKDNFLFHASLGSKELFHSNLLAWILEQRNSKGEFEVLRIFIKTVAKLDVGIITDDNNPIIAREENKIDLTIKWKGGDKWNLIFIENKMKSIPTPKQLNEYDGKIDKFLKVKTTLFKGKPEEVKLERKLVVKFLLTPFPSDVNSNRGDWKNITYSNQIIEFLNSIMGVDFLNNEDVKFIIEKYISFLSAQNEIVRFLNLDDLKKFKNRNYDFYSKLAVENKYESEELNEESESKEKHFMTDVRSLRLHDLVLKLAHQKISQLIENQISTNFENLIVSDYEEFTKGSKKIFVDHSFSRGTGISTVSILIKKNQAVSLQLQGDSLRYFAALHGTESSKNIDFAKQLEKNKIWFYDLNGELLSGKGWKNKDVLKINDSTAFNSYGPNFIYLNKNVSEYNNKPISELVDLICGEVKRVVDNFHEFEKLIP